MVTAAGSPRSLHRRMPTRRTSHNVINCMCAMQLLTGFCSVATASGQGAWSNEQSKRWFAHVPPLRPPLQSLRCNLPVYAHCDNHVNDITTAAYSPDHTSIKWVGHWVCLQAAESPQPCTAYDIYSHTHTATAPQADCHRGLAAALAKASLWRRGAGEAASGLLARLYMLPPTCAGHTSPAAPAAALLTQRTSAVRP
jgi:hypothetical protein